MLLLFLIFDEDSVWVPGCVETVVVELVVVGLLFDIVFSNVLLLLESLLVVVIGLLFDILLESLVVEDDVWIFDGVVVVVIWLWFVETTLELFLITIGAPENR